MTKKLKTIGLIIFGSLLTLPVHAQGIGLYDFRDQVFRPDNLPAADTTDISAEGRINEVLDFAINLILFASGSVAVLILIIGGIIYITSLGNDDRMEQAKKLLKGAAVGLAAVILAFALVDNIINLIFRATS